MNWIFSGTSAFKIINFCASDIKRVTDKSQRLGALEVLQNSPSPQGENITGLRGTKFMASSEPLEFAGKT